MGTLRTIISGTLIIVLSTLTISCSERKTPECFDTVVKKNYNGNSDTLYFYVMNDLERTVQCAKTTQKDILIMFYNDRYSSVKDAAWKAISTKRINTLINEHFVVAYLPTDDRTSLSYTTTLKLPTGKKIETKGDENLYTQIKLTGSNLVAVFVIVDTTYKIIKRGFPYHNEKDNVAMYDFLESSISSNE